MKVIKNKTIKKVFTILGIIAAILLVMFLVVCVYRTMTNTTPPTTFIITNDTGRAVKVSDCFTRDNHLEPGQSGTVQVDSQLARAASCELEDAINGERLGCLFAPQPVREHDIILISSLEPNVPSSECGRP